MRTKFENKKASKIYSIGFETMIGMLIAKENVEMETEKVFEK